MWSITSPRPSPPKQGHLEFSFSAAEHLVGGQGVNGWLQRLSGKDTLLRSWKGGCDLHFCSTFRFQKPLINASSSKFYF